MNRAVFLDRDGVLNELILNPVTGAFEPPHTPEDLVVFPETVALLRDLQNAGYALFLVSNQPDYAKGKTTLENIRKVQEKFDIIMRSGGVQFREYYYCHHHPDGIIPEYSFICKCRKPEPYFLEKAAQNYDLDLGESWMIGDRDSDIECGKAAGTWTILIEEPKSSRSRGSSNPDFISANLKDAVAIILQQ